MGPFLTPLQEGQLKAVSGIISATAGVIGGVVASAGLYLLLGTGQGSLAGLSSE